MWLWSWGTKVFLNTCYLMGWIKSCVFIVYSKRVLESHIDIVGEVIMCQSKNHTWTRTKLRVMGFGWQCISNEWTPLDPLMMAYIHPFVLVFNNIRSSKREHEKALSVWFFFPNQPLCTMNNVIVALVMKFQYITPRFWAFASKCILI